MRISAIIPTRNRVPELRRVLECFRKQSRRVDKIIIVDSSDESTSIVQLINEFIDLPMHVEYTIPSVCIQRNEGIKMTSSDFIFLCDDDMVLRLQDNACNRKTMSG
jgi:glycosyltransferase involved in cell wall biosynthesis